jgi:competence ComEA-like helix-hairpin-helix protein
MDYRQQNGPFRNTGELLKVEGIGMATYEKIKHLITVAD